MDIIGKARSPLDGNAKRSTERHVSRDQFVGDVYVPSIPQLVVVAPNNRFVRPCRCGRHGTRSLVVALLPARPGITCNVDGWFNSWPQAGVGNGLGGSKPQRND